LFVTGEIPETPALLMDSILNDKEAKIDSPEMNVEYRMSVREYEDLTPYRYKPLQ
jgi:magnesium chelatase subunit H